MRRPIVASVLLVGCSFHLHGVDVGGQGGGGGSPIPVADAGGGGGGAPADLGAYNGGTDASPTGGAPCYSEDFSPGVSLADLRAAYTTQQWKADVLEVLKRRIAGGHALIDQMQNDSQLAGFADRSSFDALMSSLMMVCNGETSIYDYGRASTTAFAYFVRADLTLQPAIVPTFPRSELLPYITDGATQAYDGALSGNQGAEDLTAVADDLTAFTNGLGCVAAVADQLASGISARDGMAASLYYLELYLKRARTAHASTYAALQASADWQKVVRYLWARAAFWRKVAAPSSQLGVADGPIWAHVDDPANSSEIAMFAGSALSDIECHP
ncbi:MAG TPA: hypothetical protein VF945_21715 [Polyangia bacterium]